MFSLIHTYVASKPGWSHTSVCLHFETCMPIHASFTHLYTYCPSHLETYMPKHINIDTSPCITRHPCLSVHLQNFANTSLLCIQVEPSTRDSQLGMIRIPVNYPGERFRNQVFNIVQCCSRWSLGISRLFQDTRIRMSAFNNIAGHARPVIFCRCLQSYIRLQQQS